MTATATATGTAWAEGAAPLAEWTQAHLINRTDTYGRYYGTGARTEKVGLTNATLKRHFAGDVVVGVHALDKDSRCQWFVIDIDRHGDEGDAETNLHAARHWAAKLEALSLHALIEDSNGRGGLHVWVLLDQPVAAEWVREFADDIVADFAEHGLTERPEVFPKQSKIPEGGYGSWLRVPGHHHRLDHWSRFWDEDGERWLVDADAVRALLNAPVSDASLIPEPPAPKPRSKAKPRTYTSNLDDEVRSAKACLDGLAAWRVDDYHEWVKIGFALFELGDAGLDLWDGWSSTSDKYESGACAAKWSGFKRGDAGGVTMGTLVAAYKSDTGRPAPAARRTMAPTIGTGASVNGQVARAGDGVASNGVSGAGGGRMAGMMDAGGDAKQQTTALGQHDQATGRLVLSPRRTLPTAEAYIREFHQHDDGRTLHNYAESLLGWRGNRYCQIEDEAIKHRLQGWLHQALQYIPSRKTGRLELVDFASNPGTVKQALDTIRSYTYLPATTITPSWLGDQTGRPPATEILPCLSANLHIPTGLVIPATPALFTTNALDFDYDPDPEPPERWIQFMEQLWGDDIESVETLQEWMGYTLVADTSQHKMLLLVGPRRSGKGTIGRVLTRLVGASNVVGPTTSSLAGDFGLQPLINKSLAIVSDARFTGPGIGTVVERLLCISGEDTLTIARKFLGSVSMKLPTRFMFLTNELPRLNDASTALAGRFLVLRLVTSFYGREDPRLTDELLTELPGILLWSIEGWKRLARRQRFEQPASATDAIRDLEDLASPVGAFVRERCEIGPGLRVWIDELYAAWRDWCEQDGRTVVTNKQTFGRDLATAVPGILRRRGTGMASFYQGLGLLGGAS